MLQWNGSYAYSPTLNFQAAAYFRQFNQQHVDGNGTDVTPCPPYSCLNGAPVHDTLGGIIPDISQGGTLDLGEDDDNQTQSRSVGVSGQAVDTDKIYGHDNTLTVGTSLDYGWTHYIGSSQLGTITFTNNSYPVTPYPVHHRRVRQLSEPDRRQGEQHICRRLRPRHVQRDRSPDADRRRAFQFCRDQSRGHERRSPQRLLGLLPSQSDGRPDLQDHA